MSASWMTAEPVWQPFVEVLGSRIPARTVQYTGYPGFFHHAPITGLPADTDVHYAVGHGGSLAPGTETTFRTGPGARVPFTFTAFGDQGIDQPTANHRTSPAPTRSWRASSSPPFT